MRILRSRRGLGFIDVIITLFVLAIVGSVFSAMFPAGFGASRQARDYKVATAIAQRKMEQLRAMNYESLTYTSLLAAGAIDSGSGYSPYYFTAVENVGSQLASGTGYVSITSVTSELKRVRVYVRWEGAKGQSTRRVRLTTLFADRRTRKIN